MNPPVTHLLYLHGFRSSPASFKAQMLAAQVQAWSAAGHAIAWACPQLPPSPALAWRDIQALTTTWPAETMAVVGSSLGGFYATVLAQARGCRAALINPAVAPARDLARYIGEQTSFHNPADRFFFRPEFIGEFEAIAPYPITRPERYWTLIAQGDEVLDWREMVAAYPSANGLLLPGGDHAVSDFAQHLPALCEALGLPAPDAHAG